MTVLIVIFLVAVGGIKPSGDAMAITFAVAAAADAMGFAARRIADAVKEAKR